MKVIFAVMPWHSLEYPCLASGILSSVAASRPRPWRVQQINVNLLWAAHLRSVTQGVFSLDDYALMCNEYVYCLAGEWAFSDALTGRRSDEADAEYECIFSGPREHFNKLALARNNASTFLDRVASEIVEQRPQLLALSTTFTQNVACLALAKRVKAAAPEIAVVMGGGNCDGEQGLALHRNYGFIDFLVRGEGELAFAQLLDKIAAAESDFGEVGGLCWRLESQSIANESRATAAINDVPTPQFDDFFAALDATGLRAEIRPSLVFEAARGCWWGEKHHCTFCGLNGGSMAFRSKEGSQALAQLEDLIQRHRVLDVIVTDNILDTRYFDSFLPQLRDKRWDARIQYEIKANVKAPQLKLMSDAGVVHVQPGIESLSTTVLQLMRKGTTGCRNIQALRDLEHARITVSWNYLVGFPRECESDYRTIIEQMRLLYHLQPPRGGVTRVSLQRFSPFFNDPTLGFPDKRPHEAYGLIYDLPEKALLNFKWVERHAG
jgi:ribosomal peptide maturation radical SAM protein 1